MSRWSRRRFVQGASSAGLLAVPVAASAAAAVTAGTAPAAGADLLVREDIAAFAAAADKLAALKRGIAAMMARPATDPTSWTFQAAIHGTYDDVPPEGADTWQTCQHGTFFFLSWHRMYLYHFERILRAASGMPGFALPYWNYGEASQRSLPDPFRTPASPDNPLFVAARARGANMGRPLPDSATSASDAMKATDFASASGSGAGFGGQAVSARQHFSGPHGKLESQPHDVVHSLIGGNGGLMADPNTAARDPIFWLHHCNIDRLWSQWLALGGRRRNPQSRVWLDTRFTFHDETGKKVTMSGAEVVDAPRQLHYRYDDAPLGLQLVAAASATEAEEVMPAEPKRVLAALANTESAVALRSRDATVMLQPAAGASTETAAAPGSPVVLSFDDIAFRRPVGLYYEVYVNRPADAPFDPHGPYYAGNLSFFALGHAHGGEGVSGARATLDATDLLARQKELGLWSGGDVRVDLHPSSLDDATEAAEATPLATVGRIRLLGQ